MSKKITMTLGMCYKLVTPVGVYEFKFIGGEPIKGELFNGEIIEIYSLLKNAILTEIKCPKS